MRWAFKMLGMIKETSALVSRLSATTHVNERRTWWLCRHRHNQDIRHTVASVLLAEGTPIPEVQQRLGHSSPIVTMTIYAHALPGKQAKVTERLAGLFGAKTK